MKTMTPILSILPANQRLLWERLNHTPRNFVLYGGTALALRLGHRESVGFDFFSCQPFKPIELLQTICYLKDQKITQQGENTLSCDIDTEKGAAKISFFGGLFLNQINEPDIIKENGIAVASLWDIFGTKCATVPQRNEIKDYQDIHTLIKEGGILLSEGIGAARAIYGRQYNPILTTQALSYFGDLPGSLTKTIKADLLSAVKSVSLDKLPLIKASRKIGESVDG